eukprot:jgi/Psemu1/214586/e_gw1.699.19.1
MIDNASIERKRFPSARIATAAATAAVAAVAATTGGVAVVTQARRPRLRLSVSLLRIVATLALTLAFALSAASAGIAAEGVAERKDASDETRTQTKSESYSPAREPSPPWQNCSVVLAPTGTNRNWGVIANRDFSRGEIVDISPLTVPIPDGTEVIERSVLNDYVYGYLRIRNQPKGNVPEKRAATPVFQELYSVLLGPDMFYNHHPVAPSVEFTTFGREPSPKLPGALNPQGFVAKRDIRAGEELFVSYNGRDDGGEGWFRTRGVEMEVPSTSNQPDSVLLPDRAAFCSKIYAGIGLPAWRDRLLPLLPKDRSNLPFSTDAESMRRLLAPFDAGWGGAKTRVDVRKGERLEISTALVLSRTTTQHTALMPLVYAWADLHEDHRRALERWEAGGRLHLQYQGPDTDWNPERRSVSAWDDIVVFPVAGSIGMVRRRTLMGDANAKTNANCKLVVHPPEFLERQLDRPVGVTVELIATEDLAASTTLVVDLDETVATPTEYQLLYRELKRTGQPFEREVFADRRRRRRSQNGASASKPVPGDEL